MEASCYEKDELARAAGRGRAANGRFWACGIAQSWHSGIARADRAVGPSEIVRADIRNLDRMATSSYLDGYGHGTAGKSYLDGCEYQEMLDAAIQMFGYPTIRIHALMYST